jgi:hypothetical protein
MTLLLMTKLAMKKMLPDDDVNCTTLAIKRLAWNGTF